MQSQMHYGTAAGCSAGRLSLLLPIPHCPWVPSRSSHKGRTCELVSGTCHYPITPFPYDLRQLVALRLRRLRKELLLIHPFRLHQSRHSAKFQDEGACLARLRIPRIFPHLFPTGPDLPRLLISWTMIRLK